MVLYLDIEVLAEYVLQTQGELFRLFVLLVQKVARNIAREAGGERDEPIVMLFEQVVIYAGLIVEAVDEGDGRELHQVLIARFVFT